MLPMVTSNVVVIAAGGKTTFATHHFTSNGYCRVNRVSIVPHQCIHEHLCPFVWCRTSLARGSDVSSWQHQLCGKERVLLWTIQALMWNLELGKYRLLDVVGNSD